MRITRSGKLRSFATCRILALGTGTASPFASLAVLVSLTFTRLSNRLGEAAEHRERTLERLLQEMRVIEEQRYKTLSSALTKMVEDHK